MLTSKMRGLLLPATLAVGVIAQADAHSSTKGQIAIIQPWSRATAPRADTDAAYLTLRSDTRSRTS